MRLSFSAYLVLGVAALYVFGRMALHYRACGFRLQRACRLYGAGRIAEGDRVVAAVMRSRSAFQRRHPRWRLTPDREQEVAA